MNGFVDFKKEKRQLDDAEYSRVNHPASSAVPTVTAKTQQEILVDESGWDDGETRVGTDNGGEFIVEKSGSLRSSVADKKVKLIAALVITVIGIGGVGYYKSLRPAATYNSVEFGGTSDTKRAQIETVFNPLTDANGAAKATPESVKPSDTVITEMAATEARGTSVSPSDKAVVSLVEMNNEAVNLQAADVKQLRVDLNNLEATVNKLHERLTLIDATKPVLTSAPRTVRKPIQILTPNVVKNSPDLTAEPAITPPRATATAQTSQRIDAPYPTVLGVDIWDGKPSVVVGMANDGKTGYKVYSAGDRVDGVELRQADHNNGTVVFGVSGSTVQVTAKNQAHTTKSGGRQNVANGAQ